MVVQQQPLVIVKRHANGVTELRLNRPQARNAFSQALYTKVTTTLTSLNADPHTRIILLTATGETFSAGMDIKQASSSEARKIIHTARAFMQALLNTTKIIAAVVHGSVVGIGVTLLLHCDFVYCSHDTTFATPFPEVGLVPEFAASVTFPLWLGKRRAGELLLMGRVLKAAELTDVMCVIHGGRKVVIAFAKSEMIKWSEGLCDEQWRSVEAGKARMGSWIKTAIEQAMKEEMTLIEGLVEKGVTQRLMGRKARRMARL